ncbi:MAG TPA: hypothetical protein VN577_09025 [Terriglobales bacterium]|nr:hypothetical protein [Terriglobales bacterium]
MARKRLENLGQALTRKRGIHAPKPIIDRIREYVSNPAVVEGSNVDDAVTMYFGLPEVLADDHKVECAFVYLQRGGEFTEE